MKNQNPPIPEKFEKPFPDPQTLWIVIDARAACQPMSSGISRFTVGLTTAFAELLKDLPMVKPGEKKLRILIISKFEPAEWIVRLVQKYPSYVSFWSGGPGVGTADFSKPAWLWSTRVYQQIQMLTKDSFVWLAPANFDRPLFLSKKTNFFRVVQLVHDTIPFMPVKGMSFLFKTQFKILVRRTLNKLPHVLTVSEHSAKNLSQISKKRTAKIGVVPDAVDEVFGSYPRITDGPALSKERNNLIKELSHSLLGWEESTKFLTGKWCLGVGRQQKYKNWDLACDAVQQLSSAGDNVWFIRIGGEKKDAVKLAGKKHTVLDFGAIRVIPGLRLVMMQHISDRVLAKLYQLSDVLVHPSQAEGFGLPPLEAVMSGLPVVYKTGSAMDDFFQEGTLPETFWNGVEGLNVEEWKKALHASLYKKSQDKFYNALAKASESRSFVSQFCLSRRFSWKESAKEFYKYLTTEVIA